MALKFYYGSGSPYAWRVWLALAHKSLAHDMTTLSFDRAEHKAPAYLALNPRGLVPTLVDGDFVLWEAAVILEYLEDRNPAPPLFEKDIRRRALQRRMIQEIDAYLAPALRALAEQVFDLPPGQPYPDEFGSAVEAVAREVSIWEERIAGPYAGGPDISAIDLSLFPFLALVRRLERRLPENISAISGHLLLAWMNRMDALPIVQATLPPHWK